ncbi:PREDICTED: protein DDX26B-like [Dipodomys ordii]|uniref:Protein DDX26B-like n=1 Tax=Dipodomys ordii TaxID=10020 RepID=A0A1S3FC23_DIPOR|nr:PREDICTED: protein DDX26B-like [Dipodomys ordii]
MADKADHNPKMLTSEVNPVNEEVMVPLSSTTEKQTEELTFKNKQGVEVEVKPETSAKEKTEGDSEVEMMPELAVVPDPLTAENEELNAGIKRELKKEIQNLGYGYQYIFQLLEEVQGPLEMKREVVLHAIREAARFNCQDLTVHLESALKKINYYLNRDDSPDT